MPRLLHKNSKRTQGGRAKLLSMREEGEARRWGDGRRRFLTVQGPAWEITGAGVRVEKDDG